MKASYEKLMGRYLIQIGALIILLGIGFWLVERMGLPRMPGDIVLKRKGWSFYFPLGTSIILSIVLTLLLNFFLRRR